jgi:hypothetical protein
MFFYLPILLAFIVWDATYLFNGYDRKRRRL